MQRKELNFVVQKVIGLRRIKGRFLPKWKDLEFYPCGLHQKYLPYANYEAQKSLKKQKENKGTYRIIKRYIPIPKNNLQLHFELIY